MTAIPETTTPGQMNTLPAVIDRDTQPQSRTLSVFSCGTDAFETANRMAMALCTSTMVPEAYRGQANLGNCLIALDVANRLGASPLAVMQHMVPVHGRPSWSSTFLIGTVNSCGRFTPLRFQMEGDPNTDSWGCRAIARDRSTKEDLVGTLITIAMAKAEGWHGRNGSKWKTMPEQMLQYRAAAFWTRLYAPELSLGMQTQEEVIDITASAAPRTIQIEAAPSVEQKPAPNEEPSQSATDAAGAPPADPLPEPSPLEAYMDALVKEGIPHAFVMRKLEDVEALHGASGKQSSDLSESDFAVIRNNWRLIKRAWAAEKIGGAK